MFSSRRADDADVIRARLRALLAEGAAGRGWLPDDDPDDPDEPDDPGGRGEPATGRAPVAERSWEDEQDEDSWSLADATTAPLPSAARVPRAANGRHRAAGPSTRVDPGPHGARTVWVVALLAALAVAGWSWLGRPDVEPVAADGASASAVPAASTGSPATGGPTPAEEVVVAVVGQVAAPGLVTLPAGSRVADAVAAAGGLLPEADPASVNAAAPLTDGQQVAVGVPGAAGVAAGSPDGGTATGLVDLNTAALADLDALPGIGPVLAQRILDHRAQQGPFGSVEELDDVSGIGPALFAEISPLVTV